MIKRREPAHGLPGGGLPERRRVLGARHRDVHDPRRHLHAPLRLLQRQDRQADLERPARAAARRALGRAMGLRHAVITSVDRDDLPDYGASAFVGVIRQIRMPGAGLQGRGASRPTSAARRCRWPRSSPSAPTSSTTTSRSCRGCTRSPAAARRWERSLRVLRNAKEMGGDEVVTKSGLMVGLGETHDEMVEAFGDAARARRPGPHRRPVPAPDRAPPAGRALLAPGRVRGARGRRPTRSASTTSPPARSCARATTPTSTSRRTQPGVGPAAPAAG